jgi:protein phosphatase 1 regulatory subunit 21
LHPVHSFTAKIASLKRELEMVKHEKEQVVLDAELLRIQVQKRRQQGSTSDSPTAENDNLLSDDEISREALIKEHYMARIGQLSAQLHYTDGRAVAFFEECKALALKVGLKWRLPSRLLPL